MSSIKCMPIIGHLTRARVKQYVGLVLAALTSNRTTAWGKRSSIIQASPFCCFVFWNSFDRIDWPQPPDLLLVLGLILRFSKQRNLVNPLLTSSVLNPATYTATGQLCEDLALKKEMGQNYQFKTHVRERSLFPQNRITNYQCRSGKCEVKRAKENISICYLSRQPKQVKIL